MTLEYVAKFISTTLTRPGWDSHPVYYREATHTIQVGPYTIFPQTPEVMEVTYWSMRQGHRVIGSTKTPEMAAIKILTLIMKDRLLVEINYYAANLGGGDGHTV